jgi:hypothetical protein
LTFCIDDKQARRQLSGRTRSVQPGTGKLAFAGNIWIEG